MADGNLGKLFFELGVKENVSKDMNRVLKAVQATGGSISELKRELAEYQRTLSGNESDKFRKGLGGMVNKALDYLNMLQKIEKETKNIADLKLINSGIKSSGLDVALEQLKRIKNDLLDLQKGKTLGGVDNADLSPYAKALRNTLDDVRKIEKAFDKENSLSVSKNNAARLNNELEKVKNKLAEIYSLQSQGMRKGINTSSLLSGGNSLRGVRRRIENMLGDDKLLSNEAKVKSLLSDIAFAFTKATGKIQEYNREKAKISESNHTFKAEANDAKVYGEKLKSLELMLKNLQSVSGDALRHGMNLLPNTQNALNNVQNLIDKMRQFDQTKFGDGKSLNELLSKFGVLKMEVNDVLKTQSNANKSLADSLKKTNSEINKAEIAYNNLKNVINRANEAGGRGLKLFEDPNATNKIRQVQSELETLRATLEQIKNSGVGIHPVTGMTASQYISSAEFVNTLNNAKLAIREQEKLNNEQARTLQGKQTLNKAESEHAALLRQSAKAQADLVRGFERANSHAGKLNSTVQDLKSLFLQGGLVFGAQQFAMSIVTTGGEMEKQHIALQSILGDMQNANTLFGQIKELALNSPFTFSELNRDVKQLAAYGVEYNQLYDTTKRLADMSSGLGVSFDRIALAFGQVQARGWLDGKELRQIAYAGIPLLNKLSEFYSKQEGRNVSTSEIKTRISNREVSFDDVKNIFWQMTDAGGQFYNMQQILSETLLGKYNKLKDAWEIMLSDFASGNSLVGRFFKTAIEGATTLVQSLHTLALPVGALFAGYALKKMLAGGTASNFLANKASMAGDIQARLLQGQQLTQVEKNILATKNQITNADLKTLATAKALTLTELNRLRLSGRITAEQYKTYRAMVMQQTAASSTSLTWKRFLVSMRTFSLSGIWSSFSSSGMAAIRLVGTGLKSLGATLWSAIGGLPGLIISGITFGITYAISEYQELSQKIKQTQDEIADRNKQIQSFLKDNNVSVAISKGDDKEIDNMIEAYKDKLKQLAPYGYQNMVMTADEKKSHKDRLLYLEQEIKLLKEANDIANSKMSNRSYYSDLESITKETVQALEIKQKLRAVALSPNATQDDKNAYEREKAFDNYIESYKKDLEKKFGDIAKDEKMRQAAMQSMSALFSSLGVPEDKADMIRASILQAFGIGEKSSWLQGEVRSKMLSLIDATFPLIGDKIRASIPLNDAEKAKVKELMGDAKNGLIQQYPELETTLQKMLAESKFEAVIKLVFDKDDAYNEMQSTLVGRIPKAPLNPELLDKYRKRAKEYGKDNNWYNGRNAAQTKIKEALNNWKGAKASKAPGTAKLYQDYLDEMAISNDLLYYNYKGELEKSNKPPKKTRDRQEDKQLEDLKTRISLYKKMYAEIKKYKDLYGKGALGQLANDGEFESIFKNKKGFPISDYTNYETSIKEILGTLPSSTKDRINFKNTEKAGIQSENRKLLEEQRKDELGTLDKQLDIISEQYDTYKKIYQLTGNKKGSQNIAFGGTVQFDSYKKLLEEQLDIAVKHDNVQSGLSRTTAEVKGMSLENVKDQYGENTRVYDIRKKLEDENNKIKKETIDLMANLIQKNATIEQQIEDENRSYERQLELIKGIEDPQMRQRAKEGAEKTHNENSAKLQFEQFKQESDWVTIFDDLNRVSSATINSMIDKIDDFSRTTGLSVEVVKQLRDALDKLRTESIERNPLPSVFGGVRRGNAIGSFVNSRFRKGMDISTTTFVGEKDAKKMGIKSGNYTKGQLQSEQQGAYKDSSVALSKLTKELNGLISVLSPVNELFEALGEKDSVLGKVTGGASNALSAAANVSGGLDALGLSSLGPYGAAAGAALSVASSVISAFGADYSSYEKAKAEYETLSSIWDSLISKKTEYMNIHWGTEATEASKEAQRMLEAEIEQTKIVAKQLLGAGASAGSHSIGYRIWNKYGYNGKSWKDIAPEIARRYGVQFNGIEDLLNMDKEVLTQIKTDYTGFWANLDGDYRDYLEKLIEYGDKADEMVENLTEKLTGNKFSDLVSSWGDAMASMANSSDNLVDNFEDNLKKAILNSMIENIYGDKIKALIAKTQKYAENSDKITDGSGNVISEYTGTEYADVKESTDDLAKQIEATRDFLKKTYGWSDNSSSSSTNSVKGITEEEANLGLSYLNAIRLDCSVMRAEQAKFFPEMSEIAKSQLTQLSQISQNTLRNAEAAERIETVVTLFNDNFNRVLTGTKVLHIK